MTVTMIPTQPYTLSSRENAYSDQNLRRILHAVLLHAMKEAIENNQAGSEARSWLLSRACAELCENSGINHPRVRQWVMSGCPGFYKKRASAFFKNSN